MSLEEKLKDWERKRTTIDGVFILKILQRKNKSSRIIVEINPIDEFGNLTKKRRLILRNLEDLKEFRELLNIEKLEYLLKEIENVNPKIKERIETSKEEIEI